MRMSRMTSVREDPAPLSHSRIWLWRAVKLTLNPLLRLVGLADCPLIRALVQAVSNIVTDNFCIVAAVSPGLVRTAFDLNVISSVALPAPCPVGRRLTHTYI